MRNVMVSYFKINQKVQNNKIQSRPDRADPSRLEQAKQSTIREIIIDQDRDGARRLEQIDLREMNRLERIGVKASGEKMRQIGVEREHQGQIEDPCQERSNNNIEKIGSESEKSSADQRKEISVVKNDKERGEDLI